MKDHTLIEKVFILRQSPFFKELNLDVLLTLSEQSHSITFNKDETIFSYGDEEHGLYIIAEGEIILLNTKNQPIAKITNGDVFGEEAVFSGSTRQYQAQATSSAQTLFISQSDLFAIIEENPSLSLAFLQIYGSYLPISPLHSSI